MTKLASGSNPAKPSPQTPRRARDLGITTGRYPTGPRNALTDVAGVRVGHTTVRDGTTLHTGVTAIVPDAVDCAGGSLPAGLFVGNGFGKLIGATQLAELGAIETPILLTGTLSAFRVADALVSYVLAMRGNEDVQTLNPIVGETNDGFLSDIRRRPVTEAHVIDALGSASADDVQEGCVGAGTGTGALGFKGGIGTASRVAPLDGQGDCTVGVLVQSNFSGTLRVRGVPISRDYEDGADGEEPQGNSCMIIVAVDRGLDSRQLRRVATRAVFGLARIGSDFAQGSGDYGIAFSTVNASENLPDAALDPAFFAAQEAVEEAVLNSLTMATTTHGHHAHTRSAVSHAQLLRACRRAGAIPD
ncbi:P1 family peptidase [Leekyejoonella antrihumi]|uniref:P1 family peptidase n=1 Tax=Leekyejoonella antrihumi TaxID=1660198 RepID=A0A563E4F9_9MICO|nr:P1 family peptidase [Leekyejoonella antrihumi]TWP37189.1 P1 family peptidase [Leekyejoonella antrihumi]